MEATTHPLAAFRRERGMSRAEIAQLLGVTVAMIGHVERGVRRFDARRALEWQRDKGIPATVTVPELFAVTGEGTT